MPDEIKVDFPMPETAGGDQGGEPEKKELNEVETLAKEMGWNPDFEGAEGKESLSARDYIKKGRDIQKDMRDRIKTQGRSMQEMQDAIKSIQEHNDKVNRAEVNKLKKQLAEKKNEAIIDGDIEAVKKADDELEALKEQEKANKADAKTGEKAFKAWHADNKWFGENLDMSDFAQYRLNVELRKNPNMTVDDQLSFVRQEAEKKFPEYFGNGKGTAEKKPPTSVNEGGARPGSGGGKTYTAADLSSEQKAIMKNFVKTGALTEKQYIADLVKIGELGGKE